MNTLKLHSNEPKIGKRWGRCGFTIDLYNKVREYGLNSIFHFKREVIMRNRCLVNYRQRARTIPVSPVLFSPLFNDSNGNSIRFLEKQRYFIIFKTLPK